MAPGATAAAHGELNFAQTPFTASSRGRAVENDCLSDHTSMTPERAGVRHHSPHGGDGAIDPLSTKDLRNSLNLKLSHTLSKQKHRVQDMSVTSVEAPPFPGGGDSAQPSNADLIAKLKRMMGAMALKEDVHIARLQVVKQMRSVLTAQMVFSFIIISVALGAAPFSTSSNKK